MQAQAINATRGGAGELLRVEGLSKSFGAVKALSNVSLTLSAGDAIGIVGPNGAGKSTLLAAIAGAFPASEGRILLNGEDVTHLDATDICRRGVVRTHQIPKPFGGLTVFENARVAAAFGGQDGDPNEQAYEALHLCQILPIANRRAATLGLLDRKRLEMARAIATGPRVLLLDEVGGGLSDAEADILVGIIREIRASGCAIIWIEHMVHVLVQVVERLICMDMGAVIADGDPELVMKNERVMKAYLGQVAG